MSNAAAAAGVKNVRDEDGAVEAAPPAKKPAAEKTCKCDRCYLRNRISDLIAAALDVVQDDAKEPDPSTADEERRRRVMRANVSMAFSGVVQLASELLPSGTRHQTRPALPGHDFRNRTLREDFYRVLKACNANSPDDDDEGFVPGAEGLTFVEMFARFRELIVYELLAAQTKIGCAADAELDDTLLEHGTIAHIVMHCSTGCCRSAFKRLRELAAQVRAAVDALRECPAAPECIKHCLGGNDDDDASCTDVDEVPAVFELQNASQDPRAEFDVDDN